ncbi:MAG: AAA family ATPase, partial [candidate division WOR-3 bacterium]
IKLKSMGSDTVRSYIAHRLTVAGSEQEVFSPRAIDLICRYSEGRPRLVNVICDNALLEGYLQSKPEIDEFLIERVVSNLGLKFE